jgi:hypothetical protein
MFKSQAKQTAVDFDINASNKPILRRIAATFEDSEDVAIFTRYACEMGAVRVFTRWDGDKQEWRVSATYNEAVDTL